MAFIYIPMQRQNLMLKLKQNTSLNLSKAKSFLILYIWIVKKKEQKDLLTRPVALLVMKSRKQVINLVYMRIFLGGTITLQFFKISTLSGLLNTIQSVHTKVSMTCGSILQVHRFLVSVAELI